MVDRARASGSGRLQRRDGRGPTGAPCTRAADADRMRLELLDELLAGRLLSRARLGRATGHVRLRRRHRMRRPRRRCARPAAAPGDGPLLEQLRAALERCTPGPLVITRAREIIAAAAETVSPGGRRRPSHRRRGCRSCRITRRDRSERRMSPASATSHAVTRRRIERSPSSEKPAALPRSTTSACSTTWHGRCAQPETNPSSTGSVALGVAAVAGARHHRAAPNKPEPASRCARPCFASRGKASSKRRTPRPGDARGCHAHGGEALRLTVGDYDGVGFDAMRAARRPRLRDAEHPRAGLGRGRHAVVAVAMGRGDGGQRKPAMRARATHLR